MGILVWLAAGLSVGFVADKLAGDPDWGVGLDLVLGALGAVLGGLCFQLIGGATATGFNLCRLLALTGFNLWSLLAATVGAIAILLLWHVIAGKNTDTVTTR